MVKASSGSHAGRQPLNNILKYVRHELAEHQQVARALQHDAQRHLMEILALGVVVGESAHAVEVVESH